MEQTYSGARHHDQLASGAGDDNRLRRVAHDAVEGSSPSLIQDKSPVMSSSRAAALAAGATWFDSGALLADLQRRVGYRTESQNPHSGDTLTRYLTEEIRPSVERLGFRASIWANPVAGAPPMLFAERIEDPERPTVLIYGHG